MSPIEKQSSIKPRCVYFESRAQATVDLLDTLAKKEFRPSEWIVIALSFGAVPIASRVAEKLNLFFDVIFTESIFAPNNKECIIAMVSETEDIVVHSTLVESFGINLDYIYSEANRKYEEKILKKVYKLRKGEPLSALKGKNVLLVDEGCETGLTALCSIKTVINKNAKSVYFATPIIASEVVYDIQTVCDDILSVRQIENFVETAHYYESLPELSLEAIYGILEHSDRYLPFMKKQGENV